MNSDHRSAFANDLRGPAALTVVVGHFLHNAWYMRPLVDRFANVDMPKEAALPTPWLAQWLSAIPAFDWGAYGVAVFFLISGFVIPLSLDKYTARGFAVGRVLRIWPTYAAGFSVTLISIWLAGRYFGKPFPYSFRELAIHYVPGLRDLLWSTNIDGVIWTLEVEVKFYVVCALAAPLIRRRSLWLFAVPAAIGVACWLLTGLHDRGGMATRPLQLLGTLTFAGEFVVFMFIGTAMAYAVRHCFKPVVAAGFISALTLLFYGLSQYGPWRGANVPLLAYAAALLTFIGAAVAWKPVGKGARLVKFLADISYPLYACHIALGYVLIAVLLRNGHPPLLAVAEAVAAAIAVATVIHWAVEAPTHRLGQRLARALSRRYHAGHPVQAQAMVRAPRASHP